jgi:hypothetical protein
MEALLCPDDGLDGFSSEAGAGVTFSSHFQKYSQSPFLYGGVTKKDCRIGVGSAV